MTAVVTALSVELLRFSESPRVAKWMAAVRQGIGGIELVETRTYTGRSDWLLLWGPGAPERAAVIAQHVESGRHAIAFDLAYWQRDRKVRVSIDAAHPGAWVMRRAWSPSRFQADGIAVEDRWSPTGPVIVAGLGRKARVQYGTDVVAAWEVDQIARARQLWPDRPVVFRRKQQDAPVPAGVTLAPDGPIDRVLEGASLLVTWHSNVAVDAIRVGIPVVCRDGAAAAVSPSGLSPEHRPLDPTIRAQFLANLAWFQWAPEEAPAMWTWLRECLA